MTQARAALSLSLLNTIIGAFPPFLNKVRANPTISGLLLADSPVKVSEYAENLLFSLTLPHISLPNLLKEFEAYGALSSLKINFQESKTMGLAISPESWKS